MTQNRDTLLKSKDPGDKTSVYEERDAEKHVVELRRVCMPSPLQINAEM